MVNIITITLLLLLPPPPILVLFQYVPEIVQSQTSYVMGIDKLILVYMERQNPSQHNVEGRTELEDWCYPTSRFTIKRSSSSGIGEKRDK